LSQQNVSPDEEEFLTPLAATPASSSSSGGRLRLRVVQASGATLDKIVDSFPFTVGREGNDLNIGGDQRISRKHTRISWEDNSFFVTDLGGVNGTILGNQKLPPNTPTPLGKNKIVRLTSQTHLEVEPLT
jgi:pSer/pThr/pTyr-binding forkhead associated (FHA) protein